MQIEEFYGSHTRQKDLTVIQSDVIRLLVFD